MCLVVNLVLHLFILIHTRNKEHQRARVARLGNSIIHSKKNVRQHQMDFDSFFDSIAATDSVQKQDFDGFFDRCFSKDVSTLQKFKSNPTGLNTDSKPSSGCFSDQDLSTLPKSNPLTLNMGSKPSNAPTHKRNSYKEDQIKKSSIESVKNDLANFGSCCSRLCYQWLTVQIVMFSRAKYILLPNFLAQCKSFL